MKILTRKNGIALIAVLTVLLVLTLLLPVMFKITESATARSVKASTEQQASYFARTSVEMAVMAFEEFYDAYEQGLAKYTETGVVQEICQDFDYFKSVPSIKANRIYFYLKDEYIGKDIPKVVEYGSGPEFEAWQKYEKEAVLYKAVGTSVNKAPAESGYTPLGFVDCEISYEEVAEYYRVKAKDGSMQLLVPVLDDDGNVTSTPEQQYNNLLNNYVPGSGGDTCFKVERNQARFKAVATIGERQYNDYSRSCLVILPTKTTDKDWLVPTNIENNQIFVDSTKATGISELSYDESYTGNNSGGGSIPATNQPLYSFSYAGNMIISTKGLPKNSSNQIIDGEGRAVNVDDLSLGVRPVTTTKNPERDPAFKCLATQNMSGWSTDAQKDNFIMFSSATGIQVEMPVNLLINPCRTMRLGDGIARNYTLYKLLVFQAPDIIFQRSVNSMISLWKQGGLLESIADTFLGNGYDARRVTSIILAAPETTPYSYYHKDYNTVVKAGKVCFMEDAYIWLIPVTENGSNYKTQTVYYKGSDIELHKIADAGDVFYFNAEVGTQDGKNAAGLSLSSYFMDVKYHDIAQDDFGWQFWKTLRAKSFGFAQKNFIPVTYKEHDFEKIGNIYTDENIDELEIDAADDIVVVWDS